MLTYVKRLQDGAMRRLVAEGSMLKGVRRLRLWLVEAYGSESRLHRLKPANAAQYSILF